ncbi:hypothetical protein [Pedococcus bigeumensis]|uniref:hypothetical protein n=1 Tax=Pedococcus bigeumensis TaxID=433644 RepID=UPI002FEDA2F6
MPNGRTSFVAVDSFAFAFDVVVGGFVVAVVVEGVVVLDALAEVVGDVVAVDVVAGPVEVVAVEVDVVVVDGVVVAGVVVDGVVELVVEPVVVTGVGSVVPANAAPGTTSEPARARASAAAGRALRRVRCMVPLQCERCRDGCTGTRT